MDYAAVLHDLETTLREYYNATLKNNIENLRQHMEMIHQQVAELEIATQKLEREHAERITITFR